MQRNANRMAMCIDHEGMVDLTFAELDLWAGRMANALVNLGIEPGERIAVQVEKSPLAIALHFACLRGGFVYIPLNPSYTASETMHILSDSCATLLVCDPLATPATARSVLVDTRHVPVQTLNGFADGTLSSTAISQPEHFVDVERAADDVASILYTSGTTGKPKGAMLTNGNLAFNAKTVSRLWQIGTEDVLLHPLPIFHRHGLYVACHNALMSGCTINLLEKFDTRRVIQSLSGCTLMMGVPAIYSRLLKEPGFTIDVLGSVRLFISGSAPLPDSLYIEFRRRTGQWILNRYGSTETLLIASNPVHGRRMRGSVGKPLPSVEVRIAGSNDQPLPEGVVGNVQVRGPNVFAGYLGGVADTTTDGYLRQGDLGRMDDGYLTIVGRSSDLIISGGFNVYPKEVENVLQDLEGIDDAAVFGVPHSELGEGVVAAIVAAETLADEDIEAHLRSYLVSFKVPKRIIRVSSIPTNALGKVLKSELKQAHATVVSDDKGS